MRVAILSDRNTVENIIIADTEEMSRRSGSWVDVTDLWCDLGALYDPAAGGTFTPAPNQPGEGLL